MIKTKIKKILKILIDKKAEDIRIFNVKENSDIWDYFIICSAISEPHLRALYNYLEEEVTKENLQIFYKDLGGFKNWIVLDLGDVLVHIFDKETRLYYSIEKLWGEKEEKIKNFLVLKTTKSRRKNVYKIKNKR